MAKKTARRRPKPAPKTPARKPRPTQTQTPDSFALVVRDPSGLLPQAAPLQAAIAPWALGQEPTLTIEHLGTFKLSKDQVAALRKPVTDREIDWKPSRKDGPPEIPYLSHNGYRNRLDEAFGLGGWGLAPTVAPKEKDGIVYCQWALFVDGKPRIYAWGEQAYHATNKQMTYGDALEGTKSNAIVRCGKELGIARELWDRRFIAGLKRRVPARARQIFTDDRDDGPRPPVPVVDHRDDDGPSESRTERPKATARTGDEGAVITLAQRTRLFTIGKDAGRSKGEITTWIKAYLGLTDSGQITRADYDRIVALVEKRGPLPRKEKVHVPDEILPPITDEDIRFDFGENRR